jgi:hypothetical protein
LAYALIGWAFAQFAELAFNAFDTVALVLKSVVVMLAHLMPAGGRGRFRV